MGVGGVSIVHGRLKWLQGSSSGKSEQSIFSGHWKKLGSVMLEKIVIFIENASKNSTHRKTISSHEWLTTSSGSLTKKSTWGKEFWVIFHTYWSVQTTKKWSQIFRTFQLNEGIKLMCLKSRFLRNTFCYFWSFWSQFRSKFASISVLKRANSSIFRWFSLNLVLI